MRKFSRIEIEKLIKPLFEVMQSDYPNDAQLVITSHSATIEYMHTDMVFLTNYDAPRKTAEPVPSERKEDTHAHWWLKQRFLKEE